MMADSFGIEHHFLCLTRAACCTGAKGESLSALVILLGWCLPGKHHYAVFDPSDSGSAQQKPSVAETDCETTLQAL